MSYKDSFYNALAEWLREQGDYDVAKVTNFEEETENSGYCETCWYEQTVVYVTFEDSEGNADTYRYYGSMAYLIRELCA